MIIFFDPSNQTWLINLLTPVARKAAPMLASAVLCLTQSVHANQQEENVKTAAFLNSVLTFSHPQAPIDQRLLERISQLNPTDAFGYYQIMRHARYKSLKSDEEVALVDMLIDQSIKNTRNGGDSDKIVARVYMWELDASKLGTHQTIDFVPIIKLPTKLRGSFFYFYLLFHETEHTIQGVRSQEIKDITFDQLPLPYKILTVFELERNAILAEWWFLHHMPPKLKIQASKELMLIDNIYYKTALDNAAMPAEDYLKAQWKLGRHSYKQITKQVSKKVESVSSQLKFGFSDTTSLDRCEKLILKGE